MKILALLGVPVRVWPRAPKKYEKTISIRLSGFDVLQYGPSIT